MWHSTAMNSSVKGYCPMMTDRAVVLLVIEFHSAPSCGWGSACASPR